MFAQKIVPMEPHSKKTLVKDPDYFYQIKWDGIRLLTFISGEKMRLQGRSLKDKSLLYPELAVLPELVQSKNVILDGEIIAFHKSRPDFYTVMQREQASPATAARLARSVPVYYMVFDLLYYDGVWLLEQPWEARQEIIFKQILTSDCLQLTANYREGKTLLQKMREKGMEGVVAKKKGSPYIPGPRRSSYWFKVKIQQALLAHVGGVALRNRKPVSLLLGLEGKQLQGPKADGVNGGKLRYIGNVSSGLNEKDWAAWHEWAFENSCPESPFENYVPVSGRGVLFVQPGKKVHVTFSEWTPSLKLRAPRLAVKSLSPRFYN
ncbi:MAG: hypothetical protein GX334_03345 [Firmicutes bacterium]|nr:hypothetical protein [Bacillota bacterium]